MKVCAEEGFPIDGADLQERISSMSGLGRDLMLQTKAEEKALDLSLMFVPKKK